MAKKIETSIITIYDAEGNSYPLAGLRGEKGPKPEKGKDYFTETDKTEIVQEVLKSLPFYEGAYQEIPRGAADTLLPTEGKVMKEDFTIKKIPKFETSNEYGVTFYIGDK